MRVFKFGGASVKDANGVKNVVNVLQYEGVENTLIVVSAMGKITNALEKVVYSYLYEKEKLKEALQYIETFHFAIIDELFEKEHAIYQETNRLLGQLQGFLINNTAVNYNYIYDQVVSYGELLSTKIVSHYLNEQKINATWLDIRTIIKTDENHRNATVNWEATQQNCEKLTAALYLTQGFIASSKNNTTTTLGREGSDYSAGILAYCLQAESVTIWKDVDGVLNADPRVFDATVLLEQISYQEAIEMAFYGASVIHPKTIKPLENKKIPLYVRSFINLKSKGTKVSKGVDLHPKTSCFIVKKNQILVSISTKDFSFMVEENLSAIFKQLHLDKLKVNLIQNSAISFSVCLEDNFFNFNQFYDELHTKYKIKYNTNVTLYTVRHFDKKAIEQIELKGKLLLKQISRETVQLVIDEK
ncbi:MAG: aspartate kinase [Flavobacteriaceae bacterium]|nr:aspartate kinase [Flavobacteriaceae bacterium]